MLVSDEEKRKFYIELRKILAKPRSLHERIGGRDRLIEKIRYAIHNNILDPESKKNVLTTAASFLKFSFFYYFLDEFKSKNELVNFKDGNEDTILTAAVKTYFDLPDNYKNSKRKLDDFITNIICNFPHLNLQARDGDGKTALSLAKLGKGGRKIKQPITDMLEPRGIIDTEVLAEEEAKSFTGEVLQGRKRKADCMRNK